MRKRISVVCLITRTLRHFIFSLSTIRSANDLAPPLEDFKVLSLHHVTG